MGLRGREAFAGLGLEVDEGRNGGDVVRCGRVCDGSRKELILAMAGEGEEG